MITHEYETIYVTRPDLAADHQTRIDEKLKNIIGNGEGQVMVFEQWGKRKLAYPIRRNVQGSYQYMHYVGPADVPIELERIMNLDDSLIRYITVRIDQDIVVEEVAEAAEAIQAARVERLGVDLNAVEHQAEEAAAAKAAIEAAEAEAVAKAEGKSNDADEGTDAGNDDGNDGDTAAESAGEDTSSSDDKD